MNNLKLKTLFLFASILLTSTALMEVMQPEAEESPVTFQAEAEDNNEEEGLSGEDKAAIVFIVLAILCYLYC